jgi:hypothetical protein
MIVTTAMREAFARIPVPALVAPVGDYIVKSLVKGSGQFKAKRVWNAKLSYRTHQALVRQNIMPQV